MIGRFRYGTKASAREQALLLVREWYDAFEPALCEELESQGLSRRAAQRALKALAREGLLEGRIQYRQGMRPRRECTVRLGPVGQIRRHAARPSSLINEPS